ncbi:MAG: SurA N-terminal domain-containing protein [Deltaproteobacteria bacterium]|nr:SurA N-terminal domain-containing protein [Deltaproteobacteria bacterium]
MKNTYNFIILLGVSLMVLILAACANPDSVDEKEYVIRVGDSLLTVFDFNKAFETAKTAYPHNVMQDPVALRETRLRLLNQLTEQMLIMERAKELGIETSEMEVEKTISDIKKDYPEDAFEQTLLEFAVPYNVWEEGLRKRLLIEKVVNVELSEKITITPEEISKYYEGYYKGDGLTSDLKDRSKNIDEIIITNLRRKKLEEAYKSWIKKLQKKYTIEINKVQLEKLTG